MIRPPLYHWPISLLALAWYLLCVTDYLAIRLQITAYISAFTPDQLTYFTNLPPVVSVAWGLGVWTGLGGAVALLRRSRSAAVLLALSFLVLIVASARLMFISTPPIRAVTGPPGIWVMIGAIVAAFLFFLHARAINQRQRQA